MRGIIVFSVLVSCTAFPAFAQQPTQAQQNAIRQSCRSDFQANCSGVSPGGAAALQCLQEHAANLSQACNASVGAVGASGHAATAAPPAASPAPPALTPSSRGGAGMVREACRADYRRLCRGVRPGGGQAVACLEDNARSLSSGCRQALRHAAGR